MDLAIREMVLFITKIAGLFGDAVIVVIVTTCGNFMSVNLPVKTAKKLSKLTEFIIFRAMKERCYAQALKAIEVKIKIDQKSACAQLHDLSIEDIPPEILQKWLDEITAKGVHKNA